MDLINLINSLNLLGLTNPVCLREARESVLEPADDESEKEVKSEVISSSSPPKESKSRKLKQESDVCSPSPEVLEASCQIDFSTYTTRRAGS